VPHSSALREKVGAGETATASVERNMAAFVAQSSRTAGCLPADYNVGHIFFRHSHFCR
jgi:hypothetical protein